MTNFDVGEIFYSEAKQTYICRIGLPDGGQKELSSKDRKKLKKKITDFVQGSENGLTFSQAADAWENIHTERVEWATAQAYAPHIKRAKDHFGKALLKDITAAEVQAYVESLVGFGFAKDTVRRGLVVVNQIFDYAIVQPGSVVKFNPCAAVKIPRGLKKTRREPPTEEQIKKIDPSEEMGLFAYFIMYSGLRDGELIALGYEDIDRKEKIIHVNKAAHFIGSEPNITEKTKTEAGRRDVPLLDVLDSVLPNKKSGYVFGGDKPMTKNELYRKWARWCVSVGLGEVIEEKHTARNGHTYIKRRYKAHVTPYQFRHEYASLLQDSDVSEFDAMKAMGHSSINVTKDIYTHLRERKNKSGLAEKMNLYIGGDKVE